MPFVVGETFGKITCESARNNGTSLSTLRAKQSDPYRVDRGRVCIERKLKGNS